jgi:catechol 2,3-dioxygenase-like lactoylglutathione lyase family enzyme
MNPTIPGIHHVTAITADAQKNIDFYCGVLGLRLVKLTVNFDDPGSYHLYYGDELGRPGTIMTFFTWSGAHRGRVGPPQVTSTAFAVPAGALDFWSARLKEHVNPDAITERLGERVLHFTDPDGMGLDIIAVANPGGEAWSGGPIDVEHAIRGFHSVTISEEGYESTANVLTELMGFKSQGSEGNRFRYRAGAGDGFASIVDLICVPDARHGSLGAGIVHHVAFRTPDDEQQDAWRKQIARANLNVSPVMDRNYFHSIYYREPGGVLFEIATDSPGFAADEAAERLGSRLMLPAQYEANRAEIERILPPVRLPAAPEAK